MNFEQHNMATYTIQFLARFGKQLKLLNKVQKPNNKD